MSDVNLHSVKAKPSGAPGRSGERCADAFQRGAIQRFRRMLAAFKRDRRRGDGLPPMLVVRSKLFSPSHGTSVDAFRPAWASWMIRGISDQWRMLSIVRAIAASVASSHSPVSA